MNSLSFTSKSTKKSRVSPGFIGELEDAIRSELFTIERFEQHARSLAEAQAINPDPRVGKKLAPRVKDNGRVLQESYQTIIEAVGVKHAITPAAEWLIDSFHVVEEQLREIEDHLPQAFYNELPKLAGGPLQDYPRVYGLAWAFVAHTDSRFDPDLLKRFVRAYQTVQPLQIGELWAVAITLRVVMIENLRRLSVRIVASQQARREADLLADDLLGFGNQSAEAAEKILQGYGDSATSNAFIVQLVQRLLYQDPKMTPALQWLNDRIRAQGRTADEIVALEHTSQTAANLTVRNIITSFRLMSTYDWQAFFEEVSQVDEILRENPVYSTMDFRTRDTYRHAIEQLAKSSGRDELSIARLLLDRTRTAPEGDPRRREAGYYLLSGGRRELDRELKVRVPMRWKLGRFYIRHATGAFISSILFLSLLILAWPLSFTANTGLSLPWLTLLGVMAFFPASDLAVAIVHRLVTELIGPKHLPRLKLAQGPPPSMSTFVVIPTLLINEAQIDGQIEQLEVHYLSNPDGEVRFAILSDWTDSTEETRSGDAEQLAFAASRVAALNERHGPASDGGPRFFLFHRKRLWNPGEGKWIGWERKRGKIHEFNRYLRGNSGTSFISPPQVPAGVRYVITLDSDTKLPKGAVNHLVGTMAHPLNHPVIDPRYRRVIEGYGILQPRVTASLPARRDSSLFQRLFSGECGIDPYASAVSDVYQDLFSEGSYTGKGIYEVDAFETVLKDRAPENALLSHDLFEGSFARSGYLSDLEFFEDFPSHSEVSTARTHRWVRGDWQLLPWILGREGRAITGISRWKMIDNLRRTLSPIGMLATLLLGWCLPGGLHLLWTAFIIIAIGFPAFISFLMGLVPRARRIALRDHLRNLGNDFFLGGGHFTVKLVLLPHLAWMMSDAITRALTRLLITHRHMLEWLTAAQAKSGSALSLQFFFRRMRGAVILSAAFLGLLIAVAPARLALAAPFLLLWALSPVFARLISLPPSAGPILPLSLEDQKQMRLHARRVWRFFTTFVTEKDGYLPPDNYQETPKPVVAHRSSPTNFGLYLLSVVVARDFGWLGLTDLIQRLENTLGSLEKLPRFKGHFYNWYETSELRTLDPQYISSVDSGNLAGHLLALSQSCQELCRNPVASSEALRGIRDSVTLLRAAVDALKDDRRTLTVTLSQLREWIDKVDALLGRATTHASEQAELWDALELRAETLLDVAQAFTEERGDPAGSEVLAWASLTREDIKSGARDFHHLLPWAQLVGKNRQIAPPTPQEQVHWEAIEGALHLGVSLEELPERCAIAAARLAEIRSSYEGKAGAAGAGMSVYLDSLADAFEKSERNATNALRRLKALSHASRKFFDEMDFRFLFDDTRKLFSIGYQVASGTLDPSYYDLLASEARLTSYLAIAKGDVPSTHWFRLGRGLVPVENGAALVSWSGSMFEYLMPSLVMYTPRGSLLDQTCRLVIKRQIQYGEERAVPWGISESAYNMRDVSFTYQYSNFGVPGLGLKRGLGQDLVIAPYASVLASMYDPAAACRNFRKIEELGGIGPYGFYEAMDFTASRLPENQKVAVIQSYMAHHQGMSLVALSNVLHGGSMRHRFQRDPLAQAAELLLQERTPRNVGTVRPRADQVETSRVKDAFQPVHRRLKSPHHPIPSSHLLSNGRYALMITAAGSGYSKWQDLAITRWREDVTRDQWGSYVYLRDAGSGVVWSTTYQPTAVEPDRHEVVFAEDRARITRHDHGITSACEILVSSEDNAELRRVSLTNTGRETREIEITSYSEVVLAPSADDRAHPAFSNLFIQTEYLPEVTALLATRRARISGGPQPWMAHVVSVAETTIASEIQYETDRNKFIGRGRDRRAPVSVMDGRPLSNTVGAVLDPVVSIRTRVTIEPGETASVVFSTLAAQTREQIIELAEKYHHPASFERSSTLAWTQAQVQLHYLGIDADEAHVFQKLANRILYSDPLMRPSSEVLKRNALSTSGLWSLRISGDFPILLVKIDDPEDQGIIRQLMRAHEYWRMKSLAVDLVILNEKGSSYAQELQNSLEGLARSTQAGGARFFHESRGQIFILRSDLLTLRDRELLQTAARAILVGRQGTLAEQVMRMRPLEPARPDRTQSPLIPASSVRTDAASAQPFAPPPGLLFFNGLGGFSEDGREYVIFLREGQRTPAPWVNVISNAQFGFHVSESGSSYTWSLNSRENQISPWSNDPVSDPPGEAIYISDHESGQFWSPTALPIRIEQGNYVVRHGQGYSRFELRHQDISSELLQLVSWDDSVKLSRLVLRNHSERARKISVSSYVEWVLGFTRSISGPYIITDLDTETGAIFACNPLNIEFGQRIAFLDFSGAQTSWTGDRVEFIGRNGSLAEPAALASGAPLSNKVGAGLDPCGAMQVTFELQPGEKREITVLLGQAANPDAARDIIRRHRASGAAPVLSRVQERWENILGKVQVETPDRAMDLVLNRWLLYQTLACRFWARAAFYQAGGAYGFRDQLQDVMALVVADPELAREHILRAAERQFPEGDVQHWWHPPTGRGVRTHFSDDRVWLPYVLSHYLQVSGDDKILNEAIRFIEGQAIPAGQEDSYFEPVLSEQQGTLFEHCARALDRSLKVGAHGLPLMGTGDWNDGMNRVGQGGKGESVWLAWFLIKVLQQFVPVAEARGEHERAASWKKHAEDLRAAVETNAWDGQWYRRAYFDDGTPLGSATNDECQIDSIAQTWSVLSGAADPARARQAMASVEKKLIRAEDRLILLFTPSFDKTAQDPGYIKGYLPGVRENGGQYTHAALWCVIAQAGLGEGEKALELFSMLNPINHAATRSDVHCYKVEPYVVAADIYGVAPHIGRGGWTWYTGSAGWMYRAGMESILGIHVRGKKLCFEPCISPRWKSYRVRYREGSSLYEVEIVNPAGVSRGVASVEVDGKRLQDLALGVDLVDDGRSHAVKVTLG